MKMTKILDLTLNDGDIHWTINGKIILAKRSKYTQALADESKNLVFALANNGKENEEDINLLHVFAENGTLIASLGPPNGYNFSYLTKHPEVGVAVVAGTNEKIDGWYDWHFGFDLTKKSLFRHCPAY